MKNINVKSVVISGTVVWILGVSAFIASYFVQVIENAEIQANWFLSVILIPAALIGAHIYYRKGHQTNGFLLGLAIFLVAMFLDAIFTVPFIIMPNGGSYISFFTDPGFWLIGIEIVSVVAAYWQIERAVQRVQMRKLQ